MGPGTIRPITAEKRFRRFRVFCMTLTFDLNVAGDKETDEEHFVLFCSKPDMSNGIFPRFCVLDL